MSLARKVYDPQVPVDGQPRPSRGPDRSIRRDLAELRRHIRILQRHAAVGVADRHRDLEIVDEQCRIGRAEPHLRAVTALLVTLDTYQSLRVARRRSARNAAADARPSVPTLLPPVNGRPVNGRPVDNAPTSMEPDRDLAAAAARYIARDLAARQLSEFTSAEAYRLARALAKLGHVEASVERLLVEANQVRLHPIPLADALSHSPH